MNDLNKKRFDLLFDSTRQYPHAHYIFYDKHGGSVEAIFNTDYESDNGLELDDEDYEEYWCIAFQRVDNGTLFEVNYHRIPVKVICNSKQLY